VPGPEHPHDENQDLRLAGKSRHHPKPGGCREWIMNVIVEDNTEIQTRVLELLTKKVGAGREIGLDSSVVEDTGLDSVSVMDFVMELEDEFDITIPLDQIAEVRTVGDLANAVRLMSSDGAHGGTMEEGH
jgi:acyl carrier protein